ncbi:MAG: type V CRISPR-associated protein Cas12a/Cpf1 [Porphyromonas sp.]|nr:type V CRISPR-associated protein Cas12a/Cpf1 [Porphyromonas sp.]
MKYFNEFTNLYPISRTLRFELKPIGKTLENIQNAEILELDEKRAESYKKVKKIIDRYHKHFIDSSLRGMNQTERSRMKNSLQLFFELYTKHNRTEEEDRKLEDIRTELREQIVYILTGRAGKQKDTIQQEKYEKLFGKELIEETLPLFVSSEEERTLLSEFDRFTTYFVGFHENRKNMYSAEPKSTAVAYRLIHENLPRFIDNISVFEKVKTVLSKEVANVCDEFKRAGYLNVEKLDDIFSLDSYVSLLSQGGIELYNGIIGKIVEEDGKELKGLNERINLYNQTKSKEERLPLFRPLYKQILSDREQLSWLPEAFTSDQDVLDSLNEFYDYINKEVGVFNRIKSFMNLISSYDLSLIYLRNDAQLTDISKQLFEDWNIINIARQQAYDRDNASKKRSSKYEENREKLLNSKKSLSIAELNNCIKSLEKDVKKKGIDEYFRDLGQGSREHNLIDEVYESYSKIRQLLETSYPKNKSLIQDKENVALIKSFLDSISNLQRFLKPLLGSGDEPNKDEKFYGELNYIWEPLNQVIPLYNKVRNYLTQKPYSTEKIKLNFGNSQLLNGWDRNKEKDNTAIILRKGEDYFLAIMDKKHNKSFEGKLPKQGDCYEKIDYKFISEARRMLPKVFFSNKGIATYEPSKELQKKHKDGTHKKGNNFNLDDLYDLINYFKSSIKIHPDWIQFGFQFSETSAYEDISEFYKEMDHQSYKISFQDVSEEYVRSLVDEGTLYLFQIYNKDFSLNSKGTPNLHTLYWRMLFEKDNLQDIVYKLNGKAEVFYRKKSIEYAHPTHPANQPIEKKRKENKGEQSLFAYDLIKDKRYTMDKFHLHVSITANFKGDKGNKVNLMVHDLIRKEPDFKDFRIIGVDRGERNLLYISVIDGRGNILHQESLNKIDRTDYHALLEKRDKERQAERQNWQTIEGIKDLKQGYLSQVVHRIAQLMVEYNAFIALEDLNMGFKRGRQKVESSVYQQFERQLIEKLSYLVDKKMAPQKDGGLLRAYQFTAPFKSFREMGKQNGFLFYVPAWNTSKIDPVTGFVNFFDTRYESVDKTKAFFKKFKSIKYNKGKDWFEFEFDYDDFTKKAEGTRTEWTLSSHGTRIRTFRNSQKNNQWDYEDIDLTKALENLFDKYGINYSNGDLKKDIDGQTQKDFFVELLSLFQLLVQIRNSRKDTGDDYLISPVADDSGVFYDSRNHHKKSPLPENADANGAYNIARKALWALGQIKKATEGVKPKLGISNKEWIKFVQEKPYQDDKWMITF